MSVVNQGPLLAAPEASDEVVWKVVDESSRNDTMTRIACYIGTFVMALGANFTPLLYFRLRKPEAFGFSHTQEGWFSFGFFVVNALGDIIAFFLVDRIGFRPFVSTAPIAICIGYGIFSGAGYLHKDSKYVYPVMMLGTLVQAVQGACFEPTLSPIITSLPAKRPVAQMAILHSCYSWCSVIVVVAATFMLKYSTRWQYVMLAWLAVPIVCFVLFSPVRVRPPVPDGGTKISFLGLSRSQQAYLVMICLGQFCAGGTELAVAQWVSNYCSEILKVDEVKGNLLGPALFAGCMGVGRLSWSLIERKVSKLPVALCCGFAICIAGYLAIGLQDSVGGAFAGFALVGLGVSLEWPGHLSLGGEVFNGIGSWVFALLAFCGDAGSFVSPLILGVLGDKVGLHHGLGIMSVFPALGMTIGVCLIVRYEIDRRAKNQEPQESVGTLLGSDLR